VEKHGGPGHWFRRRPRASPHRAGAWRRDTMCRAGAGVQPPGRRAMIEDSYRLYSCGRCRRQTHICPRCDRGQIYCGATCSKHSRRQKQREAGRRYQQSRRGRLMHARRQQRYRQRQRAPQEVTHQGIPASSEPSASKSTERQVPQRSAYGPEMVVCDVCGRRCRPFARFEPLRVRRRDRL
jgi:hypothetical protein